MKRKNKRWRLLSIALSIMLLLSGIKVTNVNAGSDEDYRYVEVSVHLVDQGGNSIDVGSNSYTYNFLTNDLSSNSTCSVTVNNSSGMGMSYIYNFPSETCYLTAQDPIGTILTADQRELEYKRTYFRIGDDLEENDGLTSNECTANDNSCFVFSVYHVYDEPEPTTVSGTVTFDDNNNQDGMRPSSATINLYADDTFQDSKTVSAADGWEYSFEDLPTQTGDGLDITYTVDANDITGYTKTVDDYNITYSHEPSKINISANLEWNDENNRDGRRPQNVEFTLYKNGEKTDNILNINESNDWADTFEDLDEYENGTLINYSLAASSVEGYTSEVSGSADSGFTVKYSHVPEKISVSGSITWNDADDQDGRRPESVAITLYDPSTDSDSTMFVSAEDNWTYEFKDRYKYYDWEEIIYTVTANAPEGYSATISGKDITCSHTPEDTSLSANIIWEDNNNEKGARPENVAVTVLADGTAYSTLTLNPDNTWSNRLDSLPVYKDGAQIIYTVSAPDVTGYIATITGTLDEGFSITYQYSSDDNNDNDDSSNSGNPDDSNKQDPSNGENSDDSNNEGSSNDGNLDESNNNEPSNDGNLDESNKNDSSNDGMLNDSDKDALLNNPEISIKNDSSGSVQTGDNANIWFYVLLMSLSMVLFGSFYFKKTSK